MDKIEKIMVIVHKKLLAGILLCVLPIESVRAFSGSDSLLIASERSCFIALRNNLLTDVFLVPNLGFEMYVADGWTVGGNWMYAWWKQERKHKYRRVYGGEVNVRKYFDLRKARRLAGHHAGLYLAGITYDIEHGKRGEMSEFTYGTGLEYGYSVAISRRVNLDFCMGIGYVGGRYKKYIPRDNHYVWECTVPILLEKESFRNRKCENKL